jgi:hypothetical protein
MPCLGAVGRRLSGRGRLILTFWGTDLLNGGKISAKLQRRLLKKAFRVTYYTAYMDKCFKEKFGGRYAGITRNINFGMNALEAIDCVKTQYTRAQIKESLGLPADSVIVCCGSNGYSTQQHEKIIAALGQLRPEYVERVFFYLHMAYGGGRAYRAKIKRLFAASGLDGRVDTAYMYMEDVARLRLAADIFILMQERDALSTALMEHMYAGSVPIVGSWLVYRELAGCLMHTAGSVRDITAQLAGIIDNIGEEKGRCAANKELIKNIGSWDESVGRWIRLYEQRETPDMLWNAQ